jgi:hypothetical protein
VTQSPQLREEIGGLRGVSADASAAGGMVQHSRMVLRALCTELSTTSSALAAELQCVACLSPVDRAVALGCAHGHLICAGCAEAAADRVGAVSDCPFPAPMECPACASRVAAALGCNSIGLDLTGNNTGLSSSLICVNGRPTTLSNPALEE